MATDKETLEQIKKLNRNLEFASSSIENLSIQLTKLCQEPNKFCIPLLAPRDNTNATRTHGYINWNSSHDILKTKNWKKLSIFTKYCGTIERWENPHFDFDDIALENIVDEGTRFPKDDLFVNVCNPLVRAEILYIKEVKRPMEGLVERFLKTAMNEMHTLSSFEEKYALKWVEPLSEAINGIKTTPMLEPNTTLVIKPNKDSEVEPTSILRSIDNSPFEPSSNLGPIKESLVQPTLVLESINDSLIETATMLEPGSDSMVKPALTTELINSSLGETAAMLKLCNDSMVELVVISDALNGSLVEPENDSMVETVDIKEPTSYLFIESVHHISGSLPKNAELKEVESASKPTKKEKHSEDELNEMTMELKEKFKKILDSLTSQKLKILLKEINALQIINQKQLEVIVDLVYEKATENSDFSKACADISHELSKVKVPSDNDPDRYINFRALLIGKCQCFFDELLEKTISTRSSDDQKELQMILDEEIKKNKMRANMKYIGELYKIKMLTCRIMEYCIRKLIEKSNDEKLECLCELLYTIGKYVDKESWIQLNVIFSNMQEIVDCKSNNISSHIKFMIQDVINLRKRKWVIKSVFDSQLKTMDQIQEEAEQRALLIKFDNKGRTGAGSDSDIQRQSLLMTNAFAHTSTNNYSIDTLKRNAIMPETLDYVKLPPKCFESISENMHEVLEKFQENQPSRRGLFTNLSLTNPDATPISYSHHEIHRIKNSAPVVPQEPFPNDKMKLIVKSLIDLFLINPDDRELEEDLKRRFLPKYHAALIAEMMNVALEKTEKEMNIFAKLLLHLIASNTIAPDNLLDGLQETLEFAPDLFIDIPMLYDFLGKILAPHIAKKYITLAKIFELCGNIILVNQGHLFLHEIIRNLNDSEGPTFVKNAWVESRLQINQWMHEAQAEIWIVDNKHYFGYKDDESVDILNGYFNLAGGA